MKAEVKVPAVGESITEATIAEWNKSSGDYVERDEVLLSLETDKASVEVVAENAGVLTIKVEEGETVEIGAVVGEIDTDAKAPAGGGSDSSKEEKQDSQKEEQASAKSSDDEKAHPDLQKHLSPAVGRVVDEKGLDPSQIQGSGRGGRITKEDAMNAKPQQQQSASSEKPKPQTELPQASGAGLEETVTRKKMSTLRKTIANRLVQSQQTAAILTTFNEIDMTNLFEMRKKYKDDFKEKYGTSLGFMGVFTKAVAEALKEYPEVNAQIDGDEIIYHNYCHVGIAVGTPKGLVVPVVRHADKLTLAQVEQSIRHYALKARDGKISIDDMSGGTFTISNGGVFGSLMSTPIINPPQTGILGMHKVEDRPMAINGQVVIRPMMYVALSYDHRIIDGEQSVKFLVRVKEYVEDPNRLLLGV
ncbi:MAG: 2-oxoglutarate dehydrogenase complex dihydrolipoyllysine-residue succinyltransferase [Bdellovibrionales bacterium]|nr:2-oxoglutarate dehydrogenase complex dihydrolipoyllysine-residue succinyltransferase [Bdellovibrionales bacterium]